MFVKKKKKKPHRRAAVITARSNAATRYIYVCVWLKNEEDMCSIKKKNYVEGLRIDWARLDCSLPCTRTHARKPITTPGPLRFTRISMLSVGGCI